MAIYMWREVVAVWDYVTQTLNNTYWISSYAGVAFTPKVDCKITKVKLLNGTYGTLKISEGDYASSTTSSVTYTISSGTTEYTLPTPYQLTAGKTYTASISGHISHNSNMAGLFPVEGTNVTFEYGNYATGTTKENVAYAISGLYTEG